MYKRQLFGLTDLQAGFAPDLRSIAVFAMLGATPVSYTHLNSGIIIKPEENAEELMYQASHYELVASAGSSTR